MAAREILIVKLGALGDVLRTTPLLRRLGGRVTWVTERAALPLLAGNPRVGRLLRVEQAGAALDRAYDLAVNFDEDPRACRLAARAAARRRVGAFLDGGRRAYCAASAPWFDRSLISGLGRAEADRLKRAGRRSYQDYLFRACGLRFAGEEYMLPVRPGPSAPRRAALESRVGPRWPAKAWPGFPRLADALRRDGFTVERLRLRRRLEDYVADVNRCGLLVCGDTLALHLGLALRKRTVAVFTCTSPHEIHGYGRLEKVVHPRWESLFYRRGPAPGLGAGLPVARVRDAALGCARTNAS